MPKKKNLYTVLSDADWSPASGKEPGNFYEAMGWAPVGESKLQAMREAEKERQRRLREERRNRANSTINSQ